VVTHDVRMTGYNVRPAGHLRPACQTRPSSRHEHSPTSEKHRAGTASATSRCMKPFRIVELAPIFTHERTELYRRTRELHAFAARLEANAGKSRYFAALTYAGLLAMMSTASAGVATTDRARARHLTSLRERLARFACMLRSMADRELLDDDAAKFGSALVHHADRLIDQYDVALRTVEADLLSARRDAERAALGIGVANDEHSAHPTRGVSLEDESRVAPGVCESTAGDAAPVLNSRKTDFTRPLRIQATPSNEVRSNGQGHDVAAPAKVGLVKGQRQRRRVH
jgi:hypothetical protein